MENFNINIVRRNKNIIVPVVCDDMFECVQEEGNPPISLSDFVLKHCSGYVEKEEEKEDARKAFQSNYYYGISYIEEITSEPLSNDLYKTFNEKIEKEEIRLKECVKEFLVKGNFPLIITTFCFPLIEKTLGSFQSVWYHPHGRNDLPFNIDGQTRIVYHIFGGEGPTTWVYNEDSLLDFMHSLHSVDYGAKCLSNYLCDNNSQVSKLLVLGSILPDWLFRFLIYPMYNNNRENVKNGGGYWLSLESIEKSLDMFLERSNYKGKTDLRDAKNDNLTEILNEIFPKDEREGRSVQRMERRNIFISYKREKDGSEEDKKIKRVVEMLKMYGVIWLDMDNVATGGNEYWKNIKKAVQNCDYFVPLVTSSYLNEFKDAKDLSEVPNNDVSNSYYEDSDAVRVLKPVVREAYYCLSSKKKTVPIVILSKDNYGKVLLNAGFVERIANDKNDSRNLPLSIFSERTILEFDNDNPQPFIFPENEEK